MSLIQKKIKNCQSEADGNIKIREAKPRAGADFAGTGFVVGKTENLFPQGDVSVLK